ncbi:hypothetical protein E3P92_03840 [Wallemia ichthyophaga]|nr:hypothetical protein E3P92_03840 [Wallemia ichthyophaga]TIB19646.1 hypothetical protein E3P89_03780 [Wallemia ichthyophaga]TIB26100.1 hypothetical protein E3P88_01318 [Wallemia ichthyophaga]TIB42621.1 hypothetical protein E3P83_01166 [Wallemia ichthyophaga]
MRMKGGNIRRYSTAHSYKHTVTLPKTNFPLRADHASLSRYTDITTTNLYNWQSREVDKDPFILHDGPPYANGNLHMGHALNKILKDIILRYKLITGSSVHYHPGWDCHGLPIELKALESLSKGGQNGPLGDAVAVRRAARDTALDSIQVQKTEFAQFGLLADMRNQDTTYRTLDHQYEMRQLNLFKDLVKNGLVYRAFRPVYWSPSSQSALAEAELEYSDTHTSLSLYVAFPVVSKSQALSDALHNHNHPIKLLCWTTTPWSLVGNMAVCVHPDLNYGIVETDSSERYIVAIDRLEAMRHILGDFKVIATISGEQLVGCTYTPPFHAQNAIPPAFPLLAAPHVSADTGTGLVHTAAAHGHDDYIAIQNELKKHSQGGPAEHNDNLHVAAAHSHSQPILNPVDDKGRFDSVAVRHICGQHDGSVLDGLECLGNGSTQVARLLEERGGWIVQKERIKHRYPHDWRTKQPILIRSTSQWFANVDRLKSKAVAALDNVTFIPHTGRQRLEAFVMGRSEWCISRQRAWGVPIPILFDEGGEPLLDEGVLIHTLHILNERGVDAWWTDPASDFVPANITQSVFKGADTMDVWFDSGTSWMGMNEGTAQRADVYLEGSDQHRGWFQSSLLTAVAAGKGAPYKTLITHGMVVDELGRKMSKSLGNGLSPLDIINGTKSLPKYGPDVLRFWAASVEYTKDVPIGPTIVAQASDSLKKIRNAARFILGNLNSRDASVVEISENDVNLGLMDKWMLHQLAKLDQTCRSAYEEHIFSKVVQALLNFTSGPLATYFEIVKDTLYNDEAGCFDRRSAIHVLNRTLDTLSKAVSPIAPYLSEEIHGHNKQSSDSIFTKEWKPLGGITYEEAAQPAAVVLKWRAEVLAQLEVLRSEKYVMKPSKPNETQSNKPFRIIKTSAEATVDVFIGEECDNTVKLVADTMHSQLAKSFVVSSVQVHSVENMSDVRISVRKSEKEKCPRCWSFNRASTQELCDRCASVIKQ